MIPVIRVDHSTLLLADLRWKEAAFAQERIHDRRKLGWVSQDVQRSFPHSVVAVPFTYEDGTQLEDCLSLNVDQIYAVTYGAVQALMARVETLA